MTTFKVTSGQHSKKTEWGGATELDLLGLAQLLQEREFRAKKDGNCFIPGELAGSKRLKTGVVSISMLVYDVDGGQEVEDAIAKLEEIGVASFLYSSYSHLVSKTDILVDHYRKWAKKSGAPEHPTLESILDYCDEHSKEIVRNKNPVFDPKDPAKHSVHIEGGHAFRIFHDPLQKYRVVLPLAEPIIFRELSASTDRALSIYYSIYHGIGQALGLAYDHACSDPSRLFFWPSSPEGAEFFLKATNLKTEEDWAKPKLLEWKAYPRVVPEKKSSFKNADGSPRSKNELTVKDRDGNPIDLIHWARKNYSFDIEELLNACLPEDMLKAERPSKGGYHVTCPYEEDHSTPGGFGTFCANGDDDGEKGWTIHCTHASCKSNGWTKLDFLAEYIRMGFITAQDLGIEIVAPVDLAEVAKTMNVDLSTLPVDLGKPVRGEETDEEILAAVAQEVESSGDIYEECLIAIRDARTPVEVRKAMTRLVLKKIDFSWPDIYNVLAQSALNGSVIQRLLQSWARGSFAVDVPSAIGTIRKIRDDKQNINDVVQGVYDNEALKGRELMLRLYDIADYYLHDKNIVVTMYVNYENSMILQQHGPIIQREVDNLNKVYAKLSQGSSLFYLDMEESRRTNLPSLMRPDALSTFLKNRNIEVPVKTPKGGTTFKTIYAYDKWTQGSSHIKEFSEVTFHPGKPEEFDKTFNLWSENTGYKGFPVFPKEGDCSLLLHHIRDQWCAEDEKVYHWVLMWLASIFQRPGDKPPTSIALLGLQGTGKSLIFEKLLGKMLGRYYGASGSMDDIVGRFSGHLIGKLLWLSEETLFSGDKKGMNRLKDRISSGSIDIEKKHIDKFVMPSFTRYVFTSNQAHALHLDPDDRRFCVLQLDSKYHQDLEYFGKLADWMENGGDEYFMHFLMNFDPKKYGMTWGDLHQAPMTDAKMLQAEASREPCDEFFIELLKYGRLTDCPSSAFTGPKPTWPLKDDGEKPAMMMKLESFRQAYDDYLRYHGGSSAKYDRKQFGLMFGKYIGRGKLPTDFTKPVRQDGVLTRMLVLRGREEYLDYAVKCKFLTPRQRTEALDNPTSHVYSTSDVI